MIWNVIDRRNCQYRWQKVNAVVEDVAHDNICAGADQAPENPAGSVDYDQREGISVAEAIAWANSQRCPVTL